MDINKYAVENDIYGWVNTDIDWDTVNLTKDTTYSGETFSVSCKFVDPYYTVARGIMAVNLTNIDTSQAIASADIDLYCTATDITEDIHIYGSTVGTLADTNAMYVAAGSTPFGTISSSEGTGTITASLNQDGLDYLEDHRGESEVLLFLKTAGDNGTAPTTDTGARTLASAENSTPTRAPYFQLTVITSTGVRHWSYNMRHSPQRTHYKGATVTLKAFTWAGDGTELEAESATVTVTDPDGTVQLDGAAMTTAIGYAYYHYNIPSDAKAGRWLVEVAAVSGTGSLARTTIYKSSFDVRATP
jgi:hypothetical protein